MDGMNAPPLVIGAGFIGAHLAEHLLAAGERPRVLTRSPVPGEVARRLEGADLIVGDASIRPVAAEAISGAGHVYYCAGGLMPAESNLDPALDASLALPPLISVLHTLEERPGHGLTFISSGGTVYGEPAAVPVAEDHPTNPITSYGVLKLAAEKYVLMYRRLHGLDARILRCANVFGDHQPAARGMGLIAAVLARVQRGEPVVLFGDGRNVRDFVYVRDVVDVMHRLAAVAGAPPVLNVGSGQGVTLKEVVELCADVTGREIAIETRPDRGFDVRAIVLDIGALRATVAFEPTPLREAVARTWAALSG